MVCIAQGNNKTFVSSSPPDTIRYECSLSCVSYICFTLSFSFLSFPFLCNPFTYHTLTLTLSVHTLTTNPNPLVIYNHSSSIARTTHPQGNPLGTQTPKTQL